MEPEYIILISVLSTLLVAGIFIIAMLFLISYICFCKTFYSPIIKSQRKSLVVKKASFIFEKHKDTMASWKKSIAELEYKDVYITSFDGLKLHGKYYEYKKDAPIEILFHGYKGSADRDMNGGVLRCFSSGRSALAVDQRAGGFSEGRVITFGINESLDCQKWVEFVINSINKDAKIILTGVSMGAATVLIASALDMPKNVVAVVADCGYTSAKEIIKETIADMHLSPRFFYPFEIIGGKIFGHFNIDKTSPIEAMAKAKIPTVFIHGDNDAFVHYEMGVRNYETCTAPKKLITIEGAGHANSYLVNPEKYKTELDSFLEPYLA
mgnify:CR=1 FL=1